MTLPSPSRAFETKSRRPVVYAVDDEVMILELITMVLGPHGYEVVPFDDPARALEALRADPKGVALVITDYAMDTMNGMEFIEQCRALAPDLKIILVSGTVNEEIYAHAAAKPDGFLSKPFQTAQLLATVRKLVNLQR
ncbi:MAG: response regulator [Verrucomicrobiota bacterium]|nr:response regulator [Limisphaera sp.]MDW8382085.1 response regulator [Verrucomicrobiota bacterium]